MLKLSAQAHPFCLNACRGFSAAADMTHRKCSASKEAAPVCLAFYDVPAAGKIAETVSGNPVVVPRNKDSVPAVKLIKHFRAVG